MFHEMIIDEPIHKIMNDWDFLEDRIASKFSVFRQHGQNIYGIRRRAINETEVVDLKKGKFSSLVMGPQGIQGDPRTPMHLHLTTAGTPHRIPHSLGYWHINDMDELYFPIPAIDDKSLGHFVVIMQTPTGKEGESFAWYCLKCVTMLYEVYYPSGQLGIKELFRTEENAIREYNSNAKHRACPECGYVNPYGYAWNVAKDTPEQQEARRLW